MPDDSTLTASTAEGQSQPRDALFVAAGCAMTLAVYGYRFGTGNHTIYLLDAMRRADPGLLRNDWFTTQTLQYHAVFGWIAHKLIEWRAIEPAFAAGYAALVLAFHAAWLGIIKQLGGGRTAYLVSLMLYYVSAAGTALGAYQFFQDSSFLPSNLANVAMLWGVYLWASGRVVGSGACFGLAGLFHLNHAVVGIALWVMLCVAGRRTRGILIGSACALAPSVVNMLLAAKEKLSRSGSMPLGEFVDLYVRLRHPHHYDPSSWPVGMWVAFLWPIPIALILLARRADQTGRRLHQALLFMLALQVVALGGAGAWYLSETLVQLSLWRFSIFVQLLACCVVAVALTRAGSRRAVGAVAKIVAGAMLVTCAVRGPFFGMFEMPGDDADYLTVCDWAREHTPRDAVFLVPPGETSFRLRARRAIVVNFKAVPQLSGELPAWRDRMRDVLALEDLTSLPRGYAETLRAIDARYASLPQAVLVAAAKTYGARFVVTPARLDARVAFVSPNGRYFLYDLRPTEATQP
jgi:hypothetical protein